MSDSEPEPPKLIKPVVFPDVDVSDDDGAEGHELGEFQDLPGRSASRWVRQPGHYAGIWKIYQDEWLSLAHAYESNPNDFYNAYHYLDNHPIFWTFRSDDYRDRPPNHISKLQHNYGVINAVSIMVVRVNPATDAVDDDETKNVVTQVWFEVGKRDLHVDNKHGVISYHDWQLDDGAGTYEEAVVLCAHKVWVKYGNDRRVADARQSQKYDEYELTD
jgi:hypothetical protein